MPTMSNNCKPDPYVDDLRFYRCPQAMTLGLWIHMRYDLSFDWANCDNALKGLKHGMQGSNLLFEISYFVLSHINIMFINSWGLKEIPENPCWSCWKSNSVHQPRNHSMFWGNQNVVMTCYKAIRIWSNPQENNHKPTRKQSQNCVKPWTNLGDHAKYNFKLGMLYFQLTNDKCLLFAALVK